VAHAVLRAHAKAVALFRGGQWSEYGGQIGLVLNGEWAEPPRPASDQPPSEEDAAACEFYMEQQVGRPERASAAVAWGRFWSRFSKCVPNTTDACA
jgi:beta-glucosidase/6-phospho-beta-glucosidase/beta-galactosidase